MATISVKPIIVRLAFLIAALTGIGALVWTVARSAVGDSFITFVQRSADLSSEARLQGADVAVRFAERDPLVHLGRGGVYLAAANEEQNEERLKTAIAELRTATGLNPEDYRAWLALGRALDRGGELAEARSALERSIALAPRHFEPRWAMGNYLLRAGERDVSFAQLRQALAGRPSALPLVFDYAWEAFQGDGRAIVAALAPTGESRSQMIALLVARNRAPDALAVWREAATHTAAEAQQVSTALFYAGQMTAAYEVWNSAPMPDRPVADAGSLLANGSFETSPAMDSKAPFLTWKISPMGGVKASLDRKAPRSGQQSLRVGFEVRENIPQTFFTQTVMVRPSTGYELSYAVKAEELRGWGMLTLEAIDAADAGRLRATSEVLPNGNLAWREDTIKFTTTAKTEAVTVRFQRQTCPDPPCLLTGRVFFDAFKLTESGK
ncbi:MAG: tetratricopeptide repeat protein [Blastocatellia bacterium]